jgi:hypothetical protein
MTREELRREHEELYAEYSFALKRIQELEAGGARTQAQNRTQVLRQSSALISAIQDALDYDQNRHHNQPPPQLRLDGSSNNLADLRQLLEELRRFNDLIEKTSLNKRTTKSAIELSHHVNTFLSNFTPMAGKGAAALVISGFAGLLYHAGVPEGSVGALWALLKR